ncbi:uncharacterized protein LOC136040704 [Artemia franciscana]|uniref:uncharacterized protein LOC136040704 n=1 Tax=Artemia franciscana TaxID=6661 RepID=UPI0032DACFC9
MQSRWNEVVLYSGTLVIDNIESTSTLETPVQNIPKSVSSDKTPVTTVEQTSVVVDNDAKADDVNQSSSLVNIVQCHSKDPNVCFEYCVSLENAHKSPSGVSRFDKDSDKRAAKESEPMGQARMPAKIENLRSEAASSVLEKSIDLTPKRSPSNSKKTNTSESFSADTRTEILKAYAELEVKCGRNWNLRPRRDSANLTDILGVKPLNPCPFEKPEKKGRRRKSRNGGRSKKLKNE